LAAELEQAYPGSEVQLIDSSGGVFEVIMDGQLIYSKKALKRHAEPGEVLRLARQAQG
jgi:selT/selW/selH-like putative selenoprotein